MGHPEFETLYWQGMTDREISNMCGCSQTAVRKWRAKKQFLYQLGKTDAQIARETGCPSASISRWRKSNHLPPRKPLGRCCATCWYPYHNFFWVCNVHPPDDGRKCPDWKARTE